MTGCEQNLARISAYLDGELSPADAVQLWRHMDDCPSCKSILDDLTAIRDNLAEGSAEGLPELPEGLHERIMDSVRREREGARRTAVPWRKWSVLAALLAVVVFSAVCGQDLLRMGGSGTSAVMEAAPAASARMENQETAGDAGTEDKLKIAEATNQSEYGAADAALGDGEMRYTSSVAPEAPLMGIQAAPSTGTGGAASLVYRGILTLDSIPPELEAYAPADGAAQFTVPADAFDAAVEQLKERGAVLTLERPEGYESAADGLVVILSAGGQG